MATKRNPKQKLEQEQKLELELERELEREPERELEPAPEPELELEPEPELERELERLMKATHLKKPYLAKAVADAPPPDFKEGWMTGATGYVDV
jgi:hypothetical protein